VERTLKLLTKNMKIYFVSSISGKQKYLANYERIVEVLRKQGHQVTESTLQPSFDYVYSLKEDQKVTHYNNVLRWIKSSDVVVTEASTSSLGVGYEISLSLEKGKSVIALYFEGHAPHFLEGLESEKLTLVKYSIDNLDEILKEAIDFVSDQTDSRFNFFISPRHVSYLDMISKKRRIPKSVYLRELIEADKVQNMEYDK